MRAAAPHEGFTIMTGTQEKETPMHTTPENRIRFAEDEYADMPVACIKVVGVGGGGVNAVNNMLDAGVSGVEFIAVNTDAKSLGTSRAGSKVQIYTQRRKGLGAGGDPAVGAQAAQEHEGVLHDHLQGADMVFVATGLGGGTGTGAAPVIAALAAQLDALVVGVVTKPFAHEGAGRMLKAEAGLEELRKVADAVIVVPNERIISQMSPSAPLREGFVMADDILRQAVQGVTDLITRPGYVNLDFQDVRVALKGRGLAVMGMGSARGPARGTNAALAAVRNPLLDQVDLQRAATLLINLTGTVTNEDVSAVRAVLEGASPAEQKIGYCFDESLGDELRVTVIAAGFDQAAPAAPRVMAEPALRRFTPPELTLDDGLMKGNVPFEKVHGTTQAPRFEIPSFFKRGRV